MPAKKKKVWFTDVGSLFETGISNKADSGVEPSRISQTIHDDVDFLTSELIIDTLQCPFE